MLTAYREVGFLSFKLGVLCEIWGREGALLRG